MYRLRLFPRSDRFPLVGLLVLLALSSCGWPMDPIPTWRLRFEGTVRHSETAAPVPNTVVQFWFDTLAPHDGEPDAWGSTNADGAFRIEARDRSLLPPAEFGVRLTPPPGSGLSPRVLGGANPEIFTSFKMGNEEAEYIADFRVQPEP